MGAGHDSGAFGVKIASFCSETLCAAMYQYVSFFTTEEGKEPCLGHVELRAPVLDVSRRLGAILGADHKFSVLFVSPEYEKSVREPHLSTDGEHVSNASQILTFGFKGAPFDPSKITQVTLALDPGDLSGARCFGSKLFEIQSSFGKEAVILFMSDPFVASK